VTVAPGRIDRCRPLLAEVGDAFCGNQLVVNVNDAAQFKFIPNRDRNGKVEHGLQLVMQRETCWCHLARSRRRWGPSERGVHHRRNNIAFTFGPVRAELGGPGRNNFWGDYRSPITLHALFKQLPERVVNHQRFIAPAVMAPST
jgi:hypothetical protein